MKKTILAMMLLGTSVQAQSAFTAYYPLEHYKDTGGALPPGSIVFKPDPIVTPPDPVDPVDPVEPTEPEPTEEEKKGDCYNRINEVLGNSSFNIDSAVKEYEDGRCAVDLNTISSSVSYARFLNEYVDMVIALGNAGIMPTFNFTRNVSYTANGTETYTKQYVRMMNKIKTSELYANVFFTPTGNYKGTYKGYKIYTASTTNCVNSLKNYIDQGFSDYYYGSLTHTSCNAYWSELYQDIEFIKTTK